MLSHGLLNYAVSGLLCENKCSVYFLSFCISEMRTFLLLCHHHSSFPSSLSPNCKHPFTPCLRLWSLTPVAHGSCSPTDVSVPQSPPGCFLAEWRPSRRVSSGERTRPDPGHPLGDTSLTNTLLGKLCWLLAIYCQLFAEDNVSAAMQSKVNTLYVKQ